MIIGAIYPSIGSVRIDGASTNDWKKEDLGPSIGYLPQEICLFNGSIKDNIARMENNANPEDIIAAAQIAGVHDMILRIPNNYDANIGFDGGFLSGGQKQRIGLARAFYRNPKLIILDEPNSSLDIIGERALMTAIEVAKEKKITTIIVSHKNSILDIVDKVMILKDGILTSFGPKKEILENIKKSNR